MTTPVDLETARTESFDALAALVTASPTSFHAAADVAAQLHAAGFVELDERADWSAEHRDAFVVRDGAIIAWRAPEDAGALTPCNIVAAHTDSPGFRFKPTPGTLRAGWQTVNAEIYGGPLLNSWLDRDLRLGARLVLRDGSERLAATGAVARIPQLAIHLDRTVNEGLALDKQQHTRAVVGLGDGPDALGVLAAAGGVDAADIAAFDAFFADAQPPARLGASAELIAAGRLDNLVSVSAGLRALLEATPQGAIAMLAAFDHEEVGSSTRTGAGGPFLEDVLARLRAGYGADDAQTRRSAAASWVVSSDVGHAVHPNYPERHDDDVRPIAGRGTIIKINANQRYATDAEGEALWRRLADAADASTQAFVSKNTVPCGSTVGPITATRLGMRTVDVGIPILSMHSARELAALDDVSALRATLSEFFRTAH